MRARPSILDPRPRPRQGRSRMRPKHSLSPYTKACCMCFKATIRSTSLIHILIFLTTWTNITEVLHIIKEFNHFQQSSRITVTYSLMSKHRNY